jgi:1-phosphofructokinase family hexose kinase
MILTVCANPCIDYTLYINDFKENKLNRVIKKVESLGGKAINVAIAVKRLGYDSYSTGFMFEDGYKKYHERLSKEDVPFIYTMCEGSIRHNNKILSLPFKDLTEINERGTPVSYKKQYELIENIRTLSKDASFTVFSGSLPPDVEDDYYYKAGKAVNENSKIVIDAEGEKLICALQLKPALIKPNLHELETATKIKADSVENIILACDKLIGMGAKSVLVSLGREGAVIYDGKEAYSAAAPQVEVKNVVGSGDCMLAAACIAMEMGCCSEAVLKSAVAAGTASVLNENTGMLTKTDYDKIFPLVETHKIKL